MPRPHHDTDCRCHFRLLRSTDACSGASLPSVTRSEFMTSAVCCLDDCTICAGCCFALSSFDSHFGSFRVFWLPDTLYKACAHRARTGPSCVIPAETFNLRPLTQPCALRAKLSIHLPRYDSWRRRLGRARSSCAIPRISRGASLLGLATECRHWRNRDCGPRGRTPQFLHTVSAFNFVEIEAQIFQSKQTRPGGSLCSCMKALRLRMQTVCPAIFSLRYAGNRDLLYCGCLPYSCQVNCHVGNSSVVQCTSSLKMSSTEFSMQHSTSNSMGASRGPQRDTTTLPSRRCLV